VSFNSNTGLQQLSVGVSSGSPVLQQFRLAAGKGLTPLRYRRFNLWTYIVL
jgi:hypothetical protein